MKTLLAPIFLLILMCSPVTWSADVTSWKPLSEVFDSNDKVQINYGLGRCAGLFLALAKSLESRPNMGILADATTSNGAKLMFAFSSTNLEIKGLEVTGKTVKDQINSDQKTFVGFGDAYTVKMNQNYMKSENHFSEDPFMLNEIQLCTSLAGLLK